MTCLHLLNLPLQPHPATVEHRLEQYNHLFNEETRSP